MFFSTSTSMHRPSLLTTWFVAPCLLLASVLCFPTALMRAQDLAIPPSTPDAATLRAAVVLAQRGDERGALMVVSTEVARRPDSLPALKLQAMLLEDLGQNADANAAYNKALLLAPNDTELLLKVGTLDLVDKQIEAAVPLLQRRTRLVPGDEEGNYYLAQAYHLAGKNELALATIQKALQAAPDDAAVQQKLGELLCSAGQFGEAMPWLRKARQADPALPRINFDLAVASFDSMDLNDAANFAAAQALAQPDEVENLLLLASIQTRLARWQEAEANLKHVLAVQPGDAQATVELGHCLLEEKDYGAAVATLQHSLQLDPTQVLAHYLLSRAYAGTGETAAAQHEASLHREMMGHLAVTMPKSVSQQGAALSEGVRDLLKSGDEAGALRLFDATMKGSFVTRGSGWMFVGATYLAMGDNAAAERGLRHALALDPNTHGANTYLGVLALQSGNLADAESRFGAELALDPNQPTALGELGEVRYRQGRWAEAAELFTRSKTTAPALLYMLCDTEFHLGKPQAADLAAETLVALGQKEPAMLQSLQALLRFNGETQLAARLASSSPQP